MIYAAYMLYTCNCSFVTVYLSSMPISIFFSISICLSIYIHLCIYISLYVSSIYLSICLSIYFHPLCLSVLMHVCLFGHHQSPAVNYEYWLSGQKASKEPFYTTLREIDMDGYLNISMPLER